MDANKPPRPVAPEPTRPSREDGGGIFAEGALEGREKTLGLGAAVGRSRAGEPKSEKDLGGGAGGPPKPAGAGPPGGGGGMLWLGGGGGGIAAAYGDTRPLNAYPEGAMGGGMLIDGAWYCNIEGGAEGMREPNAIGDGWEAAAKPKACCEGAGAMAGAPPKNMSIGGDMLRAADGAPKGGSNEGGAEG